MGFSEIYLLGADCTRPDQHSSIANYNNSDKLINDPRDTYEGLMADYDKAKEFAETKGVKIFNATRGGMLEIFQRVKLDEIIKQS